MTASSATYRLQFNRGFRFAHARAVVPYLADLGIGELYASPLLRARSGSPHGYDVTDPTRLNRELGTARQFDALVRALRRQGTGLLLDIVPNHMAAAPENPWWSDVLRRGHASPFARFFDIDWDDDPGGRLVLPVLGDHFDRLLERGELSVVREGRRLAVRYGDLRLPLAPGTYPHLPSAAALRALNRDPARLRDVLDRQHYQLAYWRDGLRRLNYRRFFDITDLAGVRIEDPAVFEAVHRLAVRLVREGKVTGLRVDHVDGLRDPLAYLRRLRRAVPVPILVEKILLGDEELPAEWPADGTTGYEFANTVNALFVDPRGLEALGAAYHRFMGSRKRFPTVVYRSKKQVIRELFPAELRDLARRLHALAADVRGGPSLERCERALVEVTACLPVYRTYTRDYRVSPRDRAVIERAVADAGRRSRGLDTGALRFLLRVLLLRFPPSLSASGRRRWLDFVVRWQQFSGPAAAKGLEDTALYRYNRLVSLNVVGGDPSGAHVRDAVGRFHRHNAMTLQRRPLTLNATSTHDSKRSEDVRARINVLSEMPGAWARRLARWRRLNRGAKRDVAGRPAPDPHDEALLYQTLVGAWPLDVGEAAGVTDRLADYMRKAAREAKTNTSWLDPDEAYEAALTAFVETVLQPSRRNRFRADFLDFQRRIAPYGAWNSLAGTLLKIASPGRPDFYQGSELWDFSLVDPDNRRPVDFTLRARLLRDLRVRREDERAALVREMLASWPDGRIKLFLTAEALAFRNRERELFKSGRYLPLGAEGHRRAHVVAFARARRRRWAVVAVPRLVASLPSPPLGRRAWRDTVIRLPAGAPERWRDVFSGEHLEATRTRSGGKLDCADVFRRLPFALLSNDAD